MQENFPNSRSGRVWIGKLSHNRADSVLKTTDFDRIKKDLLKRNNQLANNHQIKSQQIPTGFQLARIPLGQVLSKKKKAEFAVFAHKINNKQSIQ